MKDTGGPPPVQLRGGMAGSGFRSQRHRVHRRILRSIQTRTRSGPASARESKVVSRKYMVDPPDLLEVEDPEDPLRPVGPPYGDGSPKDSPRADPAEDLSHPAMDGFRRA